MRIAVFCSSSPTIDKKYVELAHELGKAIGEKNWELVTGGGHISMVEGRISAGVVVDDGSDIGGGASIMGTLSGGGKQVISIGKKCLLGANSGLGISLGENCVIEAGTYITAAAKVRLPDGEIVKAGTLSGANNLLFRRNSQDGCLEVVMRTGSWGGLNSVLHAD